MHYPSAELVAVAWAKTVGGDVDPTKVATTLPADNSAWADTGFVVVTVLNANADPHVPLLEPVVAFDCWAAAPNSNKAPWGQATALASAIQWATYRAGRIELNMPVDFYPARLLSAWPIEGPTRITLDEAGFARVRLGVAMAWTATAEVTT
jgi:hypothetical protein